MAFLDWSPEFSMGVEIFDNEHKELIAILNKLHDALTAGADKASLQQICFRLMEHAVQHFKHEEMYFEDWAYPERQAHANAHKTLRRELFAMQDKLLANPDAQGLTALSEFLRHWLTNHILNDDRQYGEFLRTKGLR